MSLPELEVACALIRRGSALLAARRGPDMREAGLWEFPGGKREAGESPEACLLREIREELGAEIAIERALPPVLEPQSGRVLKLMPYVCRLLTGEPVPREHAELRWLEVPQLQQLEWIPVDRQVLVSWLLGSVT